MFQQLPVEDPGDVLCERVAGGSGQVLPRGCALSPFLPACLGATPDRAGRPASGAGARVLAWAQLRQGLCRTRPTGGPHPLLEGVLHHRAVVDDAEEAGEAVVDGGVHRALPSGGRTGPGRLAAALRGQPRGGPAAWLVHSGKGLPLQLGRPVLGGAACAFKLGLHLLDGGGHLPVPEAAGGRGHGCGATPRLGRETLVGAAGDGAAPQGFGLQADADGLDGLRPCRPGPIGLAGRVLDQRLPGAGADGADGEGHLLHVITQVLGHLQAVQRGGETEGAVEGPEPTLRVVSGVLGGGTGPPAKNVFRRAPLGAPRAPSGPALTACHHGAIQPPDGGRAVQHPHPGLLGADEAPRELLLAVLRAGHGVRGQGDARGEVPGGVGERVGAGLGARPTRLGPVCPGVWGPVVPAVAVELLDVLEVIWGQGRGDVLLAAGGGQALLWQEGRAIHQALELRHG